MITKSKIIAIMAVMCLAFAGVAVTVSDNDLVAENEQKYITVTFDGNVKLDDVKVIFTTVTDVDYVTTLDAKAVEEMSVVSYNAWLAIEDFVDDGKIVCKASQYTKDVEKGVKTFGMGDTKTVAKFTASANADYEIFVAGVVDLMIKEATDGMYTQEELDKAVEDGKEGMYTEEQYQKAIEDAKKSVVVNNDDVTIWMAIGILAIIALAGVSTFLVFVAYKAKKANRSLLG